MNKKWVDPDAAARLTRKDFHRPDAQWRIGGKPVSAEDGKAAFRAAFRAKKRRVNIHLDDDVIAAFRAKAGERGYQTLINAFLRQVVDAKDPELGSALTDIRARLQRMEEELRSFVAGNRTRVLQLTLPTQPDAGPAWRSPDSSLTVGRLN
jgi:uncharacterized protein (DUF4415 family)